MSISGPAPSSENRQSAIGNRQFRAQFTCTKCGNCCRWPGTVRVAEEELAPLAAHLGISVYEFTERYTRFLPNRAGLALTEQPDGACVFVTADHQCAVQPVKPQQCRDFPFTWSVPDLAAHCPAAAALLAPAAG